jgi:hypothetical protein
VRDFRQGLAGFQLGHHELGDEPGDLVVVEGEFFDVDGGAGGQPGSQPWRWQASKNTRIIDSDSARVDAEYPWVTSQDR